MNSLPLPDYDPEQSYRCARCAALLPLPLDAHYPAMLCSVCASRLTDQEWCEAQSALLECALAARAAGRDLGASDEQRRRHESRAALLLSALAKIREWNHAQ